MSFVGQRIAIFGGKSGLLGQALARHFSGLDANTAALSHVDADVTDPDLVSALLDRLRPDIVINATGFTRVDDAESMRDEAFALNADAPGILASLAAERGARFVHYSTDFVFDGTGSIPMTEKDPTGPASVYGQSKLAGEQRLWELGIDDMLVIRISWLFGPDRMNFVQRMLELASERDRLTVVDDQTGSPSYTPDLAEGTAALLEAGATGLFHLCNSGKVTWCGLASAAVKMAGLECEVAPIATGDWPVPAPRPAWSVMDTAKYTRTTGLTPRHWRDALAEYVAIWNARREGRG